MTTTPTTPLTNGDARLLAELIDLPTVVNKSDYVVTLATGIADPARTVAEYEPTDKLVECFDRALSLVSAAITNRRSNAAFLHGSFGSGKSHFMAILDLLLDGHPLARSIPQLGPVVAKYNPDLQGRKVLVVPYHFITGSSMEQVVLGGYVSHVAAKHPGAPTPRVYVSDGLIERAVEQRARIGDDGFFRSLSHARTSDDGWGDDAAVWDGPRFDAAVAAPAGSPLRDELVAALLDTIFAALKDAASATAEGFVPFDDGLAAISEHAKSLGYDAVVLFCDELVLWLAGRIAEPGFVGREAQKLAKLVDADRAKRPVPIVSFIARQRDLRELVGEQNAGSEQAAVADALKFWEGRFDTITFDDNNLPQIAQKRLLRPRDPAAALEIDAVFARVWAETERRNELDVLTTDTAGIDEFRKLYPFSPALVGALVALAGAMQRERTALKAMAQLLADQRDTLRLGNLVPAGDLFDVIAAGDEPLSIVTAGQVRTAVKLWQQRFAPVIAAAHGLPEQQLADLGQRLPADHPALVDVRLAKTLLIAALVPEVSAFRNLTVARLTALNSGIVKVLFPRAEQRTVLAKLKSWEAAIGELRLGEDDHNPTVTVQLSGVDVSSILDAVRSIDNRDLRRRYLRDLLGKEMGLSGESLLGATVEVDWRGTKRRAEVVFANIRDEERSPEATFRAGHLPKVVIDYPFDEPGVDGPNSDVARIETTLDHLDESAICWLPNFFTETVQRQLGDAVVLQHLLQPGQFEAHANHLSPNDREMARSQLAGRSTALSGRMLTAAKHAYALASAEANLVIEVLSPSEQFRSLDSSLTIAPPAGSGFRDAISSIVGELWAARAPGHPKYPGPVLRAELVRTLDAVRRAAQEPNFRLDNIERTQRPELQKIVPALGLGTMGDAHLVLGQRWKDHFERLIAQHRPERLTVALLRTWIDDPEPMGLLPDHADLVIAAFVLQTNRVLVAGGVEIRPEIGKLSDHAEVRTPTLPDADTWSAAKRNAEGLGIVLPTLVSGAALTAALADVAAYATSERTDHAKALVARLRDWYAAFAVPDPSPRLTTAIAAVNLLTALQAAKTDAITTLATFAPPTSFAALGSSIAQAPAIVAALDRAGTGSLLPAIGLATRPDWRVDAERIATQLRDALAVEEHAGVTPLTQAVQALHAAAQQLLARAAVAVSAERSTPPPADPSPDTDAIPATAGSAMAAPAGGRRFDSRAALEAELQALKAAAAALHLRLSFTLDELTTPQEP